MGPKNQNGQLLIPKDDEAIEVVRHEKGQLAVLPSTPTPFSVLQDAVRQGANVDTLTKLLELQERFEKNEARKAFVVAMKRFKDDPPKITKNKHVHFGQTDYNHATLDHANDEITKGLSAVGITHTWKVRQDGKDSLTVICVLTHELGHSEETQLSGPPDNSGSKNAIQSIGSATTYLQRYTLLLACGLAAGNDTDGMTMGNALDFVAHIETAGSLDELGSRYKEAVSNALKSQDPNAVKVFMQARVKREKELRAA